MNQSDLLLNCMSMIMKLGVCPETDKSEWPKIIIQAHSKGYLYTNGQGNAFVCAYRIPKWDEYYSDNMPHEEQGNTLYVAWAVSESDDKFSLTKMLKNYIKEHDIKEIVYYRRNSNDDFKRIVIPQGVLKNE